MEDTVARLLSREWKVVFGSLIWESSKASSARTFPSGRVVSPFSRASDAIPAASLATGLWEHEKGEEVKAKGRAEETGETRWSDGCGEGRPGSSSPAADVSLTEETCKEDGRQGWEGTKGEEEEEEDNGISTCADIDHPYRSGRHAWEDRPVERGDDNTVEEEEQV